MTKTVLVLYAKRCIGKDTKTKKLRKGLEDLYSYAEKKKLSFCRAPISSFNKKSRNFDTAEFFEGDHWIHRQRIIPDIVYDKTPFHIDQNLQDVRREISQSFTFINNLELSKLMSNKWLTYQNFKKHSPKTVLIEKSEDLEKIKRLDCEQIILKPLFGSGGNGIEIVDREKVPKKQFPYIAQELITTSAGIKDLVDGPHDLRVIIKTDDPIYSYVRIPTRGKLLANLSQGAKIEVVDINKLPPQISVVIAYVSKKLRGFRHKIYSIDFAFDKKQRPWIIEMNSRPGLTLEKEEKDKGKVFWDSLIEIFKNC